MGTNAYIIECIYLVILLLEMSVALVYFTEIAQKKVNEMQIYCRDFMVVEEILVILHLYKYYKNGRNKRFKPNKGDAW